MVPANACAQTTATVREAAPIYLRPESTRGPLRTAAEGTFLRVVGTQEDWLQVEFNDPQFGLRVGWVQRALVTVTGPETTPMDLSVPSPATPLAATTAPSQPQGPGAATTIPPRPGLGREGAWFSLGMGVGYLGCEDCVGRATGLSGGLSFGGTVGRRVLLGVGTSGWAKDVDGDLLTIGTLDARVRVYPALRSGLFLTGVSGSAPRATAKTIPKSGWEFLLGVGWDIRVGRNVSLTPFWSGFAMAHDTVDANVGQLGLGITIH